MPSSRHGAGTLVDTPMLRYGWGFVTDVTDVKIRSMNIIKHHQTRPNESLAKKLKKSLYYIYIKKSSSSIKYIILQKMGHPDFSLQFQGKVRVGICPLDHFFGPRPILVTSVTSVTAKNGPGGPHFKANARSLKTRFALSERFTASSIEESLSRK